MSTPPGAWADFSGSREAPSCPASVLAGPRALSLLGVSYLTPLLRTFIRVQPPPQGVQGGLQVLHVAALTKTAFPNKVTCTGSRDLDIDGTTSPVHLFLEKACSARSYPGGIRVGRTGPTLPRGRGLSGHTTGPRVSRKKGEDGK